MKINQMVNGKYVGLLKNTFIFGVGLIGSKFVQFILLPYFTNVLTTEEYGIIDLTVTFVGLLVPLLTLELSDSVLRFGLSENIDKKSVVANAGLILVVSVILTLLLSPLLSLYGSIADYRWYIVALVISQALRVNLALFVKANNKVMIYSIESIFTAGIIASFDIIFLSIYNLSIEGYFLAEIIGNSCSIIFLIVAGRIGQYVDLKNGFDFHLLKRMLQYSVPLMFNALSWWITSFSDRMILDYFFTASEVGIYSVASKIPAIVTTLLSVFTQAWIMSAVKEYESDNDVRFFENVYIVYSAILFSLVSVVIIFIKPAMRIYVGRNFFEAWYFVPVLLAGSVFLGISNYYGAIYASAKANILEIKSTLICAISNIIFNLILIPKMSILGAVIATAFSYIIVVIVRIIDTKRIMNIQNPAAELTINGIILAGEIYFVMLNRILVAILFCMMLVGGNLAVLKRRGVVDKLLLR